MSEIVLTGRGVHSKYACRFATYMFNGLGVNGAGTVLGCVAAICVPVPICFLLYGKRIRARSKFAPSMSPEQDDNRPTDEESRTHDNANPVREEMMANEKEHERRSPSASVMHLILCRDFGAGRRGSNGL